MLALHVGLATVWGDPVQPDGAPRARVKPAEETRLNTGVFRAGLKKRGLTELLEQHLTDFPPSSPTDRLLMMRDIKLAEFGDANRSMEERSTAIAEANRILAQVIDENGDDPRRFEWRFSYARSLIYDQAEPVFTRILYRGGGATDRAELLTITGPALGNLEVLGEDLQREYDRVDKMSIRDFERLDSEGYVEKLDRLASKTNYLLVWALYYDALPRPEEDPRRASRLHEILGSLSANSVLFSTPHRISRVQVQALLLAGMTHRLLNQHQRAREMLGRALSVADGLDDDERERISWAMTLAQMERVRNDAGDGRFPAALAGLSLFRDRIAAAPQDNFGLSIVAALLERDVLRLRASVAQREGRSAEAGQHRRESWQSLQRLARGDPTRRDELYATVYETIVTGAEPGDLDPFQQCALVAGLLADAQRSPGSAQLLLTRAVSVAERFMERAEPGAEILTPEVLFNLAVARYRLDEPVAAMKSFLTVARDHPEFSGARRAAMLSVQLGAELYGDRSRQKGSEVGTLYREALETLLRDGAESRAEQYWRFYYAQLLDELGEFTLAVAQYARVDPRHEHHVESVFARVRCLALMLQKPAGSAPVDPAARQRLVNRFFTAGREFVTLATGMLGRVMPAERTASIRRLAARAAVIGAEVRLLPSVDQPGPALETLASFEDDYPEAKSLAGRVWRVRLVAYEKLDRLEEARSAIPAYLAAEPNDAGPTLQLLYIALVEDAESLKDKGDLASAQAKAEMALVVADLVHDWVQRADDTSGSVDRRAIAIQFAEANLHAGRYERARDLFFAILPDEAGDGESKRDLRVALGRAEAMFQLGDHAAALPEFNRLAASLPHSDPIRWKSLLRDLQCRSALGHPPAGIIQVIRQQKHLFSDLGGATLEAEFARLLRENQRRLDGG